MAPSTNPDPAYDVRALTAGSLKGTDRLLTMAFNEQFHTD